MVAQMIKRSRFWSLVLFGLICVVATVVLVEQRQQKNRALAQSEHGEGGSGEGGSGGEGSGGYGDETPPDGGSGGSTSMPILISPTEALSLVPLTPITGCANMQGGTYVCPDGCADGDPGVASTAATPDSPECVEGTVVPGFSTIDHISFRYIHTAVDYAGGIAAAGGDSCNSCSTGRSPLGTGTGAKPLKFARFYRSRDLTHLGSFGAGFFHNYEIRLHFLDWNSSSKQIDVIDPTRLAAVRLGFFGDHFHDGRRAIKQIELFDQNGQLLTDSSNTTSASTYFAAAKTAKLTNHDGTTFEFEVIDLDFGYAVFGQSSSKAARLTRYRDRAGYGFAVNYRTWTPEQITESPERQWQIAQVLGDAGDALTFTLSVATQVPIAPV